MTLSLGLGVSPIFTGGVSNPYLHLWGAPQSGGIYAPSTLKAWFDYARASSQDSVQVGTDLVYAGTGSSSNDYYPIGRVDDSHMFGLSVGPGLANLATNSRTFAGWTAGTEVWTAQSAGTDSPDRSVNSPSFSLASNAQSRYLATSVTIGAPTVRSIWRKSAALDPKRLSAFSGSENRGETGNLSATWSKDLVVLTNTTAVSSYTRLGEGGALRGYAATSAIAGTSVDMAMVVVSAAHHLEYHAATRASPTLTANVDPIGADGVLRLELSGISTCSVGTGKLNNFAAATRVFYRDANNEVYVNTDGSLSADIGGTTITFSSAPLLYDMFSATKIYMELGGTSHNLIWQSGGGSVMRETISTAALSWAGSLGTILCGASTVLPFNATRLAICKQGQRPGWTYAS